MCTRMREHMNEVDRVWKLEDCSAYRIGFSPESDKLLFKEIPRRGSIVRLGGILDGFL